MEYLKLIEFLEARGLSGTAYDETRFRQAAEQFMSENPADDRMQKLLRHVMQHGNAVFLSWTEQNDALRIFLGKEVPERPFRDEQQILEHTFIPGYRHFITPFLTPLILRYKDSASFEERARAASFLVLLDSETRPLIESEAARHLLKDLKATIDRLQLSTEEKQLAGALQPFLDQDVIRFVNHLSRASYAYKIEFVDTLLSLVNHPACTLRYANFLLKAAGQIELHAEHKKRLAELRAGLRNGEVRVKNHGKKKTVISPRQVLFASLMLLIGSATFWLFYTDPFKNGTKEQKTPEKTAFSQFSVEDRVKIDSLIATLAQSKSEEQEEIDPFMYLQSVDLTFREAFENETMERLVTSLDAAYQAPFPDSTTSCDRLTASTADAFLYPGFKKLEGRSGRREVVFKNASEYAVMVFVFEDAAGKTPYMQYVGKGKEITFRADAEEKFMVVPGSGLTSKSGKAVGTCFCRYDLRTLEYLHTVEVFNHSTQEARLVALGKKGAYFSVVDLRHSFF